MIETRAMDHYGREALYRLVSSVVNCPIKEAMPRYKVKANTISWWCTGVINGELQSFSGILSRKEWLDYRKSLIHYHTDYHPSGFYSW